MRLLLPSLVAASLLASLLGGCAVPSAVAPSAEPVRVRLIAFNDFHGNLEAAPGLTLPWPDPADRGKVARLNAGGAAHLAGLVKALRAGATHSIVVSSGDLIGATPLVSALFLHESTVDIANRTGVDLAAPGNHEFDAGKDELLRVMGGGCRPDRPEVLARSCPLPERHAGARFPHVAANVLKADGSTLFPASVVREVGGVRIGFIGAVTRTTPSIVVPSGVAGLRFTGEAEAINREAARLAAQGVRALVAVIHEGGDTGAPGQPMEWNDAGCPNPRGPIFDIARRLSPEIDIVFSAHTHQGYRCLVDGRPVMQATALGRGVSVADVVIDPKTGDIDRTRTESRNLPVFNERSDPALRAAIVAAEPAPWNEALRAARPDGAVAARVAQYVAAAAPLAGRPVGRIGGPFDRSGRTDASAGRLVADAQWAATRAPERGGAQFALMNPGGVRTDLRCEAGAPPCGVTYGQVFSMQPFGNSLVVMTLSGAEIRRLLEDQQRPGRAAPLFLIPSSSLTYRWDARAPHGARVLDLRVAGQPVEPGRDYRLTVNSFLAEGGDGVSMLRSGRDRLGGELDIDALVAHLAGAPVPDPVPRIALVE
ncbi:MAG: bifunctional metallophosphatase/5'-nucleotidase [Pseudomonadota bacterium]